MLQILPDDGIVKYINSSNSKQRAKGYVKRELKIL